MVPFEKNGCIIVTNFEKLKQNMTAEEFHGYLTDASCMICPTYEGCMRQSADWPVSELDRVCREQFSAWANAEADP